MANQCWVFSMCPFHFLVYVFVGVYGLRVVYSGLQASLGLMGLYRN